MVVTPEWRCNCRNAGRAMRERRRHERGPRSPTMRFRCGVTTWSGLDDMCGHLPRRRAAYFGRCTATLHVIARLRVGQGRRQSRLSPGTIVERSGGTCPHTTASHAFPPAQLSLLLRESRFGVAPTRRACSGALWSALVAGRVFVGRERELETIRDLPRPGGDRCRSGRGDVPQPIRLRAASDQPGRGRGRRSWHQHHPGQGGGLRPVRVAQRAGRRDLRLPAGDDFRSCCSTSTSAC